MAMICTTCPNSGREISTGVETDAETFATMPDVISRVHCKIADKRTIGPATIRFARSKSPVLAETA